jgi:hypothetical protein
VSQQGFTAEAAENAENGMEKSLSLSLSVIFLGDLGVLGRECF